MIRALFHSYPARLLFVIAAIVAALAIIQFRVLFKNDSGQLRPNRQSIL